MQRLYQTFQQTDLAMLAVSIYRQGAPVVKPFLEELKLTFPAVLDSKTEVARQYGLRGLPTTYLIDRDGRLVGAAVGGGTGIAPRPRPSSRGCYGRLGRPRPNPRWAHRLTGGKRGWPQTSRGQPPPPRPDQDCPDSRGAAHGG